MIKYHCLINFSAILVFDCTHCFSIEFLEKLERIDLILNFDPDMIGKKSINVLIKRQSFNISTQYKTKLVLIYIQLRCLDILNIKTVKYLKTRVVISKLARIRFLDALIYLVFLLKNLFLNHNESLCDDIFFAVIKMLEIITFG